MPEPVFYMRGYPNPIDQGVSVEMLNDLKVIKQLPPERLDVIARELGVVEGFLEPTALNAHLRSILSDDANLEALRRVILSIKSEDIDDLLARFRIFQNDDPEDFPLSINDIEQLTELLPRLLKPVPALRRYRKAERLSKITGQPLENIQLICDLRPVFDDDRKVIDGLMPFTRLRITATGGDGLPRIFEAELSAKQVEDLGKQVENANRKLAILREKSEHWADSGMPNVSLIRAEVKETSDD